MNHHVQIVIDDDSTDNYDDMLENNYWSVLEPIIDSRKYDLIDFNYHRFFDKNGKFNILKK